MKCNNCGYINKPLDGACVCCGSPLKANVVGFLYSISRMGMPEYWPLHIGKNTIGHSKDNNIVLLGKTVSEYHAVIMIEKVQSGIKVLIKNVGPDSLTKISGEDLSLSCFTCKNGDIIEIGRYQLYLIIINSEKVGLKPSDIFEEMEPEPLPAPFPEPICHEAVIDYEGCTKEPESVCQMESIITYETQSISYIAQKIIRFKNWLSSSTNSTVLSSIFAPAEIKRKSTMLVQVYLHLLEETEKMKKLAQESDKNAKRRDYMPLQCKLKKGDKVDVLLNLYGETLLKSEKKSVVWQGSFTKCSFDFFVPKNIDVDELNCVAQMTVNDIPVGEMRFITKIVESPRQLNPKIIAHKYNKVFVSYAHKDEAKVKSFHEGLKLAGIEHFFDRAYLKTGDIFPQIIQDYINSADLFVLFWSENAAESEYVKKERTQALRRAFPQVRPQQAAKLSIYPMSIEPRAELPSDMKDNYHFGEI